MYVPSFLEIFLGWVLVVVWASWLRTRTTEGVARRAVGALPWVTGAAVALGQGIAVFGLIQQSAQHADLEAAGLVRNASLGSAAVIGLALVMELLLTGLGLGRGRGPEPR